MATRACDVMGASGSQPTAAVAQKRPLEDALDRAQKFRKVGLVRLKLDLLGFHPLNRGGAGLIPYHAHEVAHDCLSNNVSLQRYNFVEVVKVPAAALEDWRSANRQKALTDKLMPAFTPKMAYACLGKTHFCHALKLGGEPGRTLMNEGKVPLTFPDNAEERAVREDGVLCTLFTEELWYDEPALKAVMLGDNLNAAVQVGEDEMQAFGRVDRAVQALANDALDAQGKDGQAHSQRDAQVEIGVKAVFDKLAVEGLGNFSKATLVDFIKFRLTITHKAAEIFRTCQQHSVGFRVQVKSTDFQLVSTLDSRCSLEKIAVLLHQYYGAVATLKATASTNAKGSSGSQPTFKVQFEGSARVTAKKLNPHAIAELQQEPKFQTSSESFLLDMFKTYKISGLPANVDQGKILLGRTQLFSHIGRSVLKVGNTLADLVAKRRALKRVLTPEERVKTIEETMKGSFHAAEAAFRQALIQAGAIEGSAMPAARYPPPEDPQAAKPGTSSKEAKPTAEGPATYKIATGPDLEGTCIDVDVEGRSVVTVEAVLSRLGLEGLGAMVQLRPGARMWDPAVKIEQGAAEADAQAHSQPSSVACKLVALALPYARIQITSGADGAATGAYRVMADELLPAAETFDSETAIVQPALVEESAATLRLEKFDFGVLERPYIQAMTEYCLHWAFCLNPQSTRGLKVLLLSPQGKLPYKFQVRVGDAEQWKKGELVLFPHSKTLVDKADAEATGRVLEKTTGKVVDETLLAKASIATRGVGAATTGAKKGSQPTAPEAHLFSLTPLLLGNAPKHRDECYANLAPFWAVPRCGRALAQDSNMALDQIAFELPGLKVTAGKLAGMRQAAVFTVVIQVMVNTKTVHAGDVLCLPFFDE